MWEKRNMYKVLVRKSERKRLLRRCKHRWENYIKMDLREKRCCVMNWINLAQDKDQWQVLVDTVMNLWVP
jgi:hypothetical protein